MNGGRKEKGNRENGRRETSENFLNGRREFAKGRLKYGLAPKNNWKETVHVLCRFCDVEKALSKYNLRLPIVPG